MSSSLLNIPKILLSLTMITLLLATHSTAIFSDIEEDVDQDEYILDTPFAHMMRSRFLTATTSIKKGVNCDLYSLSHRAHVARVCNGVSVNKGTGLLYCCKKHCRNVLSDRNNCGKCGKKCEQCERCCNGKCTNVAYNKSNCGKCGHKCKGGLPCAYGICGYA